MSFAQALQKQKIGGLATREPLTAAKETPYKDLIKALQKTRTGCAVIVAGKKVIGIFTEQDALKRGLLAKTDPKTPIEKLMTPNPTVLKIEDTLAFAIRLMHDGKYRHLPIVDEAGDLIGLISVRDIVAYLSENYPYEVLNQPPDPHQIAVSAEGA